MHALHFRLLIGNPGPAHAHNARHCSGAIVPVGGNSSIHYDSAPDLQATDAGRSRHPGRRRQPGWPR